MWAKEQSSITQWHLVDFVAVLSQWHWCRTKKLCVVSLPEVQLCYKQLCYLYDKIICCRWRQNNKSFCSSSVFYMDFLTPALFSCTGELPFYPNIFPWENLLGNNSVFFNLKLRLPVLHCCLSPANTFSAALLFIFLLLGIVNPYNMDALYRTNIRSSLQKTSKTY